MTARKKTDTRPLVLVVDDDIGIREVFAEILAEEGYRVQVAAEAESATQIVTKQRVDLALVDIWLKPGIDGIALIKRWKEGGLLSFPVAIVSGHAEVPSAVMAMRYGAMDVLTKPVGSKLLLDFVAKAVSHRRQASGDLALKRVNLGTSNPAVTVKGKLIKASSNDHAVLFVGSPTAGCEFFARLLHHGSKPWHMANDLIFLGNDPVAPLKGLAGGSLYLRDILGLTETQQRGLCQLLHNAPLYRVRVMAEATQEIKAAAADGKMIPELATLLGKGEIHIPELAEFANDLLSIITEAARMLALETGRPSDMFGEKALEMLANERGRWLDSGLTSVLGSLRALLNTAPSQVVTPTQVKQFLFAGGSGKSYNLDADLLNLPMREARTIFERAYFRNLMEVYNFNYIEAARVSGLERSYLYRKVKVLLGQEKDSGDS